MARSANQKLKLLLLRQYLERNSDEAHPVTTAQLLEYLASEGISAERKSIYSDLEALQSFGLDLIRVRDGNITCWYIGERVFQLPELRLLADSVQSSRFITRKKSLELIAKLEGLTSVHQAKELRRQVVVKNRIKAMNESIYYLVDELHTAINGDKGTKGFDGLDTLLVGTSTELNADASKAIDLSTSAAIDTNYKTVLDMLDEFLSELDGVPTMLIGNAALLTKIRSCARRAGYLTHSEDAFGRQMSGYNGIPFMDMQYYYDTAEKKEKPVVPITSREYGASSSKTTVTGLTDLYAVRLGLDGFHAVSPMGGKVISTTLPDFSTAGPVKAGDVEMVAATVLKKSRAAGVLRNFKVK